MHARNGEVDRQRRLLLQTRAVYRSPCLSMMGAICDTEIRSRARLACASNQHFAIDPQSLDVTLAFVTAMSAPGEEEGRAGVFRPVVSVPDDAPALDLAIGLRGRNPDWTPG